MANPTGTVITAVVLMAVGAGQTPAAGSERTVVLHLTDYVEAPRAEIAAAERVVARVYESADVSVTWAQGTAATAEADNAYHVDVILLSDEMVAKKCQIEDIADVTFGTASPPSRRVYLFYNRIAGHAARTNAPVSRLLGALIAHEVGHVLMPAYGHSSTGIMRRTWEGRIVRVPAFTTAEANTIRAGLTAGRADGKATVAHNQCLSPATDAVVPSMKQRDASPAQ
jgi:hypothetical protein